MIQQGSGELSQSPLEFKDRMVDMSGLQLLRAPADCLERIFKVMTHPELLWLRCEIDAYLSLPSWIQRNISDSWLPSWIPIKNLRVLELEFEWWPATEDEMLRPLWNTESEAPLQLRELKISCGLLELPKSIGQLKYLQKIELHDFRGTLPQEFFHLCSLKHLRLRTVMESLPDSLENFTNLQHIDLSDCWNLQTLPPSFGNLAMLQHIDLSSCRELQTLPASIGNLKQVQYIKLSWCTSLQRLPDSMNLIRLKHLDLSCCRDLILNGHTLENVSALERLDFSRCRKVEILPSQVTRQQFLEELILEDTNLKELPNAIGDLSNLENLAISSPSLETLPHSLRKLTKLKELRLCSGELKYFTDLVGELKPLASLLTNSPIREKVEGGRRLMDPSIDKCMLRLKSLYLSNTRITEITFGEGVCPDLEYLIAHDCDELVEVGALPTTLKELRLSDCRALKKVRGLRGLAKLQCLEMKGCKEIENLPFLDVRELDNLIDLNLEECPIGGVLPFGSVENVQGGCRLFDSSIDKCMPRLNWLNLCKTRITEISFGGGVCPVLHRLDLSGCADLVEIGALPTTLTLLYLQDCCALKKISGLRGLAKLTFLHMEGCCAVEELPGLETLISLFEMRASECENMKRILELAEAANPENDVLKNVIQLIQSFWWRVHRKFKKGYSATPFDDTN